MQCVTAGCGREVKYPGRGLCSACYQRDRNARPGNREKERGRGRAKSKRWYADPANRAKRLAYMKQHRLDNLGTYQARHRLWRTKWTPEVFEGAWVAQNGKCAICEVDMLRTGRKAHSVCADHCHANGKPRELLCRSCNTRLHPVEDSEFRAKALAYLHRHAVRHDGAATSDPLRAA